MPWAVVCVVLLHVPHAGTNWQVVPFLFFFFYIFCFIARQVYGGCLEWKWRKISSCMVLYFLYETHVILYYGVEHISERSISAESNGSLHSRKHMSCVVAFATNPVKYTCKWDVGAFATNPVKYTLSDFIKGCLVDIKII